GAGGGRGGGRGGGGAGGGGEGEEEERAGAGGGEGGGREEDVLPDGVGEEGRAVGPRELVVLALVGRPPHHAARHRPLVDPELQHHQDVEGHEADQHPRDHEDVQGEEAGQSGAGDDGSAQHQLDDGRTEDGDAAGDRRADPEPPVGVLVEAQHLSGERHAQRHEQEEDAQDPGQLARVLVGPEQEDLHHVDEDDRDHEVRAPAVHGADEPSEGHVVVEGLQAAPGLPGGGGEAYR